MRTHFPVFAIAAVGASGFLFACTINNTTNTGDDAGETPSPDSGMTTTPDGGTVVTDDAAVDAGDAATPEPQAYIRLAQWAPDLPAADVCVTQSGAGWVGQLPQLAQIVADADGGAVGDGGTPSIAFPQVTSYLIIPPGTYDVRLVAAGSADCGTGLVDLTGATIAQNTYTTIAAMGEAVPVGGDQMLKLAAFPDEVTAPAGQIALRFVNASPSQALTPADLGTGSLAGTGGPWAPLFAGVVFGQTGASAVDAGAAVDGSGYIAINPLQTATISAHASASATDATVAANDVSIAAGSATTIALVNGVSNGQAASAVKLLQCGDVDDSAGTSLLSTCSVISTQ